MCGVRAAVVNRVRARESVARAVSPAFEPKRAERIPATRVHYCKNYRSIYEGIRS